MSMRGQRPEVVIVSTGSANTASVIAAFARLGAVAYISEDPETVLESPVVVLPGVGAFGAAMAHLCGRRLDDALRERMRKGRSLLAICLGMQLLCERSDESPGVAGLGIVPARVCRFASDVRVPQMGWNRVLPSVGCSLLQPEWMYFANSFRVGEVEPGWAVACSEYGGSFVAAMERGNLLACQFHPELSGSGGLSLIERWLSNVMVTREVSC